MDGWIECIPDKLIGTDLVQKVFDFFRDWR